VIPAGNRFYWKDEIKVGSAEIAGELVANLQSAGTIRLTSTGRLFGNVRACNLVVQSGAVLVGAIHVGPQPPASG
jgi:cytoskeletal protein CcmA (bactofilin family)